LPEVAALEIKEIENKLVARSDLPARSHRLVAEGDLPAPREKFPLRGLQSRTAFFFQHGRSSSYILFNRYLVLVQLESAIYSLFMSIV
jgi:hypothetical protein